MRNTQPTAHEKARLNRIATLRTQLLPVWMCGGVASLVFPSAVAGVILLAGLTCSIYLTCCLRCPRCAGWIVIPKCPSCGLKLESSGKTHLHRL